MTLPDVRADFPLLAREARGGKRLVYLDSGATSQKPNAVLDAEAGLYRHSNAAVSRGSHLLAEEATEAFWTARSEVGRLVGADAEQIVWAMNASAAINIVASGIGNASQGIGGEESRRFAIGPGDEIVVTETEHHANLIPWQQLAKRTGATLKWIPVDDDGRLRLDELDVVVTDRCRVLAFTHASNVTGLVTDVAPLVARAKQVGAYTVLDACQSVPHLPVDFPALDVDFAAFSGHKMLGPTGIGALYGRSELLDALPPSTFGGSTVKTVTMEETTWLNAPARFEAGSQPVAQAVGMGAAAHYLSVLGMDEVAAHERELGARLREGAAQIPGVRVLGPVRTDDDVLGLAAVVVDGVHSHDVGQVLDDDGIAVRVGHHCNQPLHRRLGVQSSTRASLHVYNSAADVDAFLESLSRVRTFFGLEGAA